MIRILATPLAGQLLRGFAVAVATLLIVFVVTLALRGAAYFEWGIGASLALSLGLILLAYVLGAALLLVLTWLSRRAGTATQPHFAVLGVLMVLAIWTLTEVPLVAELRAKVCSSSQGWILAALMATVLTLVSDLVRAGHRAGSAQ
jgi:hypothetical protein